MVERKRSVEPVTDTKNPGPVEEMHEFFQLHGYYRASDLNEVLGDPRGHTELDPPNNDPGNFLINV